jgi:hypothetical protein
MKIVALVKTMLLISLAQMSAPAQAFSFGNKGLGSMFSRGPQILWRAPSIAAGNFSPKFSQKNRVGRAPPIVPRIQMAPDDGGPQTGPGEGKPSFGAELVTPVIRIQSIANVPLHFSLITSNGEPCVTRSINPGRAMSLPVCGVKIHWHDGGKYEDLAVQPMRVYRFSWSGSKWAVEDVTAEID